MWKLVANSFIYLLNFFFCSLWTKKKPNKLASCMRENFCSSIPTCHGLCFLYCCICRPTINNMPTPSINYVYSTNLIFERVSMQWGYTLQLPSFVPYTQHYFHIICSGWLSCSRSLACSLRGNNIFNKCTLCAHTKREKKAHARNVFSFIIIIVKLHACRTSLSYRSYAQHIHGKPSQAKPNHRRKKMPRKISREKKQNDLLSFAYTRLNFFFLYQKTS